jgi:hypothetical protein
MIFKIIFYNSNILNYVKFQTLDMSYLIILDIVIDI